MVLFYLIQTFSQCVIKTGEKYFYLIDSIKKFRNWGTLYRCKILSLHLVWIVSVVGRTVLELPEFQDGRGFIITMTVRRTQRFSRRNLRNKLTKDFSFNKNGSSKRRISTKVKTVATLYVSNVWASQIKLIQIMNDNSGSSVELRPTETRYVPFLLSLPVTITTIFTLCWTDFIWTQLTNKLLKNV